MSNEILREYDMDDLAMLERAQVFHNGFVADKALFEADYPHLADPFAANFQTAIDDADAIPSGAEYDSEIADKTAELNAQLPIGRKAMMKLYSYVELAWDSKTKLDRFGKNKYEKARQSQVKLKELLELANRQAEIADQKTALLAVGYTQLAIDELKTISDTIDSLNAEQEDMLAARGEKSQVRVGAYNTVWGFMQQINKASKIVFDGNPAKIDFYLLYPTVIHSLAKVQNFIGVLESGPVETVNMSWDSVEDATEYEVERSQVSLGQPQGDWESLSTVATLVLADEVPVGRSNFYRVRAKNATQTGAWADTVQVDS